MSSKPIKVLYIHHDGKITGSAISLKYLLSSLDRSRFEPHVILAHEGPAKELFENIDIEVDVVPVRGFPTAPGYKIISLSFWKSLLCLFPNFKLRESLKYLRPDILHINDKMMLTAGIAARHFNIPIVWHLRSTYYITRSKLAAMISRFIISQTADHLISISEDEIVGFEGNQNLSVIYNTVNFNKVDDAIRNPAPEIKELSFEGHVVIGTVSTVINEVRGIYDFIKAVGLLKQMCPDHQFKFPIISRIPEEEKVGSKPSQNYLNYQNAVKLTRAYGLESEIIFTGYKSNILSVMSAMDIVVICNRLGALGRMPFEAMALGCPLVVTAGHSGISKVVVDGKTALVVPPAQPNKIAQAVKKLIDNPELADFLSKNGREYAAENFDPNKNTQKIEEIYLKILKS